MAMSKEELVRLMDAYMGCGGYYMKPKTDENGNAGFFIANDNASSSDVSASFKEVTQSVGEREEKNAQLFTGEPTVECAVCADIPNITDIDE